jgi:hypothetical protein
MDILDNEKIYLLVKDYPIRDVLVALQTAINKRTNELVDLNDGHSDIAKELSVVAHHLSIFAGT